jgi:hypothetical protein
VCKEHPYAWDHHAYVNSTGSVNFENSSTASLYGYYYRFSETPRLIGMATNSSTIWAPISVIYGLPGDVMLRRLRGSIKVRLLFFSFFTNSMPLVLIFLFGIDLQNRFASKGPVLQLFRTYMREEAEISRSWEA